jgi:DNA-binding transcriptional MerR regulator
VKRHLTGPEVATILGVKPNTMRAWRSRGQGPPFNQPAGPGTQATYDPDVLALWIEYNPEKVRGGKQ